MIFDVASESFPLLAILSSVPHSLIPLKGIVLGIQYEIRKEIILRVFKRIPGV